MQDEFKKKVEEYEKTKATMNATKQQETETSLGALQAKASTSIYRQSTSTSKASTREDAAFSYKDSKGN